MSGLCYNLQDFEKSVAPNMYKNKIPTV